jgi:hypothetical protein
LVAGGAEAQLLPENLDFKVSSGTPAVAYERTAFDVKDILA